MLVAAVAGLLLAGIGSALSMLGLEPPSSFSQPLAAGAEVFSWVRWLLLPALAVGVARARESVT